MKKQVLLNYRFIQHLKCKAYCWEHRVLQTFDSRKSEYGLQSGNFPSDLCKSETIASVFEKLILVCILFVEILTDKLCLKIESHKSKTDR